MPLVSVNFLYTTGCSASRVLVIPARFLPRRRKPVQTEVKQPLLPVVCPLCKINEIANQESESSSLPHAESVSLQFSSLSDYYDHIIRCHLSLLGIPRARFVKVAQCCRANNAPMARPFCGWQCAQSGETCSSTRIKREKNARVEPLQPEECHRKPEAMMVMAGPIPQTAHLGLFLEMWNIRETHPKGGPVRTLVRYRMRTPDPALLEDAQNTTSWHTSYAKSSSIERASNRKAQHHRRTTSERYRVNSSIAARGRRASTSNGKRD